ncbi:head-specific guanylate cyclase [Ischnura elegans]|uniref:head-specific guanylate cyclase n=1 Tax=Ischnura elegans TaxID=197161 RepID=UPI001ED8853B|nr:head-specific guanylate cyclase [Ischnura elegans]
MACPFSGGFSPASAGTHAAPTASTPSAASGAGCRADDALSLRHLSDAIATFKAPTEDAVRQALLTVFDEVGEDFTSKDSLLRKVQRGVENGAGCQVHTLLDEAYDTIAAESGAKDASLFLRRVGEALAKEACVGRVRRALSSMGGDVGAFLTCLDGVSDVLAEREEGESGGEDDDNSGERSVFAPEVEPKVGCTCGRSPTRNRSRGGDLTFACDATAGGDLLLRMSSSRPAAAHAAAGSLSALVWALHGTRMQVTQEESAEDAGHETFRFTPSEPEKQQGGVPTKRPSTSPADLPMAPATFCRAFPWHLILDRRMDMIQVGTGLLRVFGTLLRTDRSINTYFSVVRPRGIGLRFEDILMRANTAFVLAVKRASGGDGDRAVGLEIKGQMVHCPESDTILFVGSPFLDGLEGLTGRGLFLSDIPIHDATRDVILVGEQSRAQDGLRRRMDKLKRSIEEANLAVDKERQKNVSLLHLIFPPDIARRLWLGESIEATRHEDVTMLFSDIVGFTSICSTATPMMVVDMLESLYSKFDIYCGQLDVYKVETIGDAYCVAGGLHRRSKSNAQRTAWMALRMIEACSDHVAHDGRPIRMRIGVHTGTVLAGVVGKKMPRYCLFGHNVTMANKFESTSEPLKINISPTTHHVLSEWPGFDTKPRPRQCLPPGFAAEEGTTCHFLLGYKHPSLPPDASLEEHVTAALAELEEPQ